MVRLEHSPHSVTLGSQHRWARLWTCHPGLGLLGFPSAGLPDHPVLRSVPGHVDLSR